MRLSKLSAGWPYLVLLVIVSVLFFRNYVPGTYLTGWDNLHPEFNFKVNVVDRSLWSAWQEYQGLGVRAGNAHAADLLRQLFLYFLSFIFAPNLLRYLYHFLALLVGAVGAFELIRRKVLQRGNRLAITLSAFIGSLFYLLNLGTLQYFYVPYEAFSHFWAFLPWLVLSLFVFLDKPNKKTLTFLTGVNLLAIPAFYIPTLFIVYLMVITVVSGFQIVQTRSTKTVLLILLAVFALNAYWLLPFLGFVANGTGFVSEVKINRIFTAEAFLRNQKFGTLPDVALLKGFLFDTTDLTDSSGQHDFIMRPWMQFLANPAPLALHYLIFAGIVIGYLYAIKTKQPKSLMVVTLFGLALFAQVNDNLPTGAVFKLLQNILPLFRQVFRFPFTKFIALASLTYAVGLAYFSLALLSFLKKRLKSPVFLTAVSFVLVSSLISGNLPSFQGNFFYSPLRQKIPAEYFTLFRYFQNQPSDAKIANLPQPTFWGWTAYDWGYRGSGFPWYGIPQPILDRAFDVWNQYNEAYYRDLSEALYTQETPLALEHVFDKYGIAFAWLDERVIMPGKPTLLALDKTKRLLVSPNFEKVFSIGKQTVYRYKPTHVNQAIGLANVASTAVFPFGDPVETSKLPKIIENARDLRIETTVAPGLLSISGTTKGPVLALPNVEQGSLTFSPLLPKVILDNHEISLVENPTTVSLPALSIANNILVLNNSVFDPTTTQPVVLYPKGNKLAVYSGSPLFTAEIGMNLYRQPLVNCAQSASSAATVFGKDLTTSDTLALFGKVSHPCVYSRLVDLLPAKTLAEGQTDNLLGFTLRYQAQSAEVPTLCLSKEGETTCFYESSAAGKPTAGSDKITSFVVSLADMDVTRVWVKLELDIDSDQMRRITLKNFTFSVYPKPLLLRDFTVAPLHKDVQLTLGKESSLAVSFDKNIFSAVAIPIGNLPKAKQNCYPLGRGTVDRKLATNLGVGGYVRYEATDASSCDQFSFADPRLAVGGISQITTRNIAGRPIKVCLAIDPPGYCLFEDILFGANKNWQTLSYITPPIERMAAFRYYLNLDNYAVGPEKRVNDIAGLSFTAIPSTWLKAISVRQPEGLHVAVDPEFWLPRENFSVAHPNPTFYKISANNPTMAQLNNLTLVLNEAFDSGWLAWNGHTLLPHFLVNNWANGWQLPAGGTTIIIFFWPQILEWLGLALLLLPFLLAFLRQIADT